MAGFYAFALGDGSYAIYQNLILVEIFRGETRVALGAGIGAVEIGGFADRAGQESAAQRAVGDEADAEFAQWWE